MVRLGARGWSCAVLILAACAHGHAAGVTLAAIRAPRTASAAELAAIRAPRAASAAGSASESFFEDHQLVITLLLVVIILLLAVIIFGCVGWLIFRRRADAAAKTGDVDRSDPPTRAANVQWGNPGPQAQRGLLSGVQRVVQNVYARDNRDRDRNSGQPASSSSAKENRRGRVLFGVPGTLEQP